MHRPERRNALSEAHLRELLHAFRAIGAGKARGAILAAEGPVFSAGHDFADMQGRDLASMRRLLAVCADLMQTLHAIPQPVVAQVEGLATADVGLTTEGRQAMIVLLAHQDAALFEAAEASQQAVLLSAVLLGLSVLAAGLLVIPMAFLYIRYKRGATIEVKV